MQNFTNPQDASALYLEKRRNLEDAASSGDLETVTDLILELLHLAKQGNKKAIREMLASTRSPPASSNQKIRFHAYITVVREDRSGTTTEQVPTGLAELGYDPAGCKDALRLLAMTEPLLDVAKSDCFGPAQNGVDAAVLKRTIISVAQHAARVVAKESRLLEVSSPVYVLGDIHGNLTDLQFFRKMLWPAGPEMSAGSFLFLGDFVDRGRESIAAVAYIMSRKVLSPSKWLLIRGNHETREVNGNMEHYQEGSFLYQCIEMFGDAEGYAVWEAVNKFFDCLPLAASIDGEIFCVHGGIPRELCMAGSTVQEINHVECPLHTVDRDGMVYQMLWSDPSAPEQELNKLDIHGFGTSARGCACFGEKSLTTFLHLHKFRHVFRGHEAQQFGVGVSKQARLTTIFSTSKDHFANDTSATCGCVLVINGTIYPLVRALAELHIGLDPTYAAQSIEATDLIVAQRKPSKSSPTQQKSYQNGSSPTAQHLPDASKGVIVRYGSSHAISTRDGVPSRVHEGNLDQEEHGRTSLSAAINGTRSEGKMLLEDLSPSVVPETLRSAYASVKDRSHRPQGRARSIDTSVEYSAERSSGDFLREGGDSTSGNGVRVRWVRSNEARGENDVYQDF